MLQNLAFPCPFLKNGFQNQNIGLFKIGRNNAIFGNQVKKSGTFKLPIIEWTFRIKMYKNYDLRVIFTIHSSLFNYCQNYHLSKSSFLPI